MILLIIISFVLFLILWTIYAPLILTVNTKTGDYSLQIPGIFKLSLLMDENLFHIRARMFFIPFRIDPLRVATKEKKVEKAVKKRKEVRLSYRLKALNELFSSFRLKYLYLDMDTEDVFMNAYLFPVFMAMRSDRIQCFTNFEERNLLMLDLRNRLANLLWIGIKYQYRSYVKP